MAKPAMHTWQFVDNTIGNHNCICRLSASMSAVSLALMNIRAFILATLLALSFVVTAHAKPVVKVKTQHYRVDGGDAAAIVSSMMGSHRLLGGHGRVGRTKMSRKIQWEFAETRSSCRVKRHTIRLDFTTQLPRHVSERRLKKRLRKHWRAFASKVKWHEGQHRKIWLSCARKAEKRVNRARAKTCARLVIKLERIYKITNAECDRRHSAFDAKETRRLSKHPLIKAAARR
jgi:predicted secreted Zn-dependent protease